MQNRYRSTGKVFDHSTSGIVKKVLLMNKIGSIDFLHVLFGTKMIALFFGHIGVLHVLQNKWNC